MKRFIMALSAVAVLVSFVSSSYAALPLDTYKASSWTEEKTYVDKTTHKLGFGLTNITIGWTAIPFEMYQNKNLYAGFFKGLWRTGTNTVGGILHTITFPVPVDIPLPDGGVHFE